jgi:hypothetical protein
VIVARRGLRWDGGNLVESASVVLGMRDKARTIRSVRVSFVGVAAAFAAMAVSACAEANQPSAAEPTTTTGEAPVPPTSPIDVVKVLEHFEYYGACGNETVAVEALTTTPRRPASSEWCPRVPATTSGR